jgi:hypothetical protein
MNIHYNKKKGSDLSKEIGTLISFTSVVLLTVIY